MTEMETLHELSNGSAKLGRSLPIAEAAQPTPSTPSSDINLLLRQSRGAMPREMPPVAQRPLSGSCSDNWYFDWIKHCYGHVPEHVGIEFYTSPPDTLPANVTWIANKDRRRVRWSF